MAKTALGDPFGEAARADDETRAQMRAKVAEEKKKPPRSKREAEADAKAGGIRWGPIIMLVLILFSSLAPFLGKVVDTLGFMGLSLFAIDHEARIMRFYEQHNPSKVKEVVGVVRKYKGKEKELYAKLEKKYGISP
ncbi:hypothetical protein T492DRAFT_845233 [Pavlovales sp. CCMP2436]|nr:hypothetical protein T492DRAFT_845233 [Pavlovales sp. CCMP2436]|mmetsp:Transcript_6049/g.15831  ORF Transcript_6049/g.15831 Transcript_6049/m.15831 type:complete len:136 (+) Transcript_6049:75-482(+)|eukprot:CAMPEP_0179898190 /NCGR_PEP_ID=MMETSP0982-20121206/37465_1 /TAXON_ID=483367 /ORGANISM="non described non described, Strain CCMP 2436" /LENGTH=135 /DNA_ID=CAMNT_0021795387 /DNA_START=44 /DNA_END=451 /DNA_ORIENTATION=+